MSFHQSFHYLLESHCQYGEYLDSCGTSQVYWQVSMSVWGCTDGYTGRLMKSVCGHSLRVAKRGRDWDHPSELACSTSGKWWWSSRSYIVDYSGFKRWSYRLLALAEVQLRQHAQIITFANMNVNHYMFHARRCATIHVGKVLMAPFWSLLYSLGGEDSVRPNLV